MKYTQSLHNIIGYFSTCPNNVILARFLHMQVPNRASTYILVHKEQVIQDEKKVQNSLNRRTQLGLGMNPEWKNLYIETCKVTANRFTYTIPD
jgi:hypothetical protein